MRLSRLLTFRSIRSRSLRFFLSAFGIILGVAGFLAIQATNQAALDSISRLFQNTSGRAKLTVSSALVDETGFSGDILRSIENIDGIKVADPLVRANTDLAEDASTSGLNIGLFGAGGGGLLLYGIDPAHELLTRDYKIVEGRFLSGNLQKREVVLVGSYAKEKEISLGDEIQVVTPGGAQKLRVVGLIAREGLGQTNNGAFGVLPLNAAQEIFERGHEIDQIDIVPVNENPSTVELAALRTRLQARLGKDYSVTYPSGQGERMTQMLQNYQIGLNFMSGIALFVGAFLIYNAFAMTVVERTREFGMLRTIGMTRRQVTGQILLEAAILGLIGSALGVGLGILLAAGLTRMLEAVLNQEIGTIQVSAVEILFSLLLGIGVTFLAALLPAYQAGRISPLEALRVRGKSREGWLLRKGWIIGLLLLAGSIVLLVANPFPYDVQFRLGSMTVFGLFAGATLLIPVSVGLWERFSRPVLKWIYGPGGSLGSRNVQRSRLRTTLTVAALMVGVAMVIMVRGMTESFAGDLRTWINAYLGGDIYVTAKGRLREDLGRRLQAVEGVQAVAPIRYFPVEWKTASGETVNLTFMALDVGAYTRVTDFVFSGSQGNPQEAVQHLKEDQTIFISSVLAEKYNLAPGDLVRMQTDRGAIPFQVVGVVVDFYNQGLVVQGSWDTMRKFFNLRDPSLFLVKVEDGQSVRKIQDIIDGQYGKRYHLNLISNESIRNQVGSLMDQAFSMFDVMALISIVVGSLGVINTLTMSVIERTREIGMLRAIGTTRGQILRMVLAEAALMGIIGGILGLTTGVVLARILFIGMTAMSGYELEFTLPPAGVAVSLVVALLVSQLAAIPPALRAARIRIIEALQYE
jgi:putative ABC transport system permease protein